MKKVITIICIAAAPILFAQEKASKTSEAQNLKTEKVKEQKTQQFEASKKAEKVSTQKPSNKKKVQTTGPGDKTYKNSASSLQASEKKK